MKHISNNVLTEKINFYSQSYTRISTSIIQFTTLAFEGLLLKKKKVFKIAGC